MKHSILLTVLIVVLAFLVIVLYSFIKDVRRFHNNEPMRMSHPATVNEVDLVSPWMTFNYINKSFALPPEYLQTELLVTDKKYPNVTLSRAAMEAGKGIEEYSVMVKEKITSYLVRTN